MEPSTARPDLNPDQRAAVTASMDPQLVVAGPGTGKTRVHELRLHRGRDGRLLVGVEVGPGGGELHVRYGG